MPRVCVCALPWGAPLRLDPVCTWLSLYLTESVLDWVCTWLSLYLTESVLDWAKPGVAKITPADRICWHQLFAKAEIICLLRSILSSFSGGQTGYQEARKENRLRASMWKQGSLGAWLGVLWGGMCIARSVENCKCRISWRTSTSKCAKNIL